MDVNRISFDQLKAYWVEVDHFGVTGKKFRNVVRTLGDYRSTLADPAVVDDLIENRQNKG